MESNIVIFVFGLAVTMITGFSAFVAIIGTDHPDESKKKS
jgi:hypothetical protein